MKLRARSLAVLAVLLAAGIGAGYQFWLRDSSLFAVEQIEIKGASAQQGQIAEALQAAAADMTTLNVDEQKLARSVSGFPTVRSISTDATPLHKLTVTIDERLPIATVDDGGDPVPVSGDGYILLGVDTGGDHLPAIEAELQRGGRLGEGGREQAAIIAGAPARLGRSILASALDPDLGVVLEMKDGPELRFGDSTDRDAKWRAAQIVLSDPDLGSPAYIDVSVAERPVAG